MRRWLGIGGGVAALAMTPALFTATPALAAQSTQPITCDGQQLTIRTNNNNSSEHGGWSSVQILSGGSGHLTPTTFSGVATDTTVNQVLFQFSSTKGNGKANHNQQTVNC